LTEAVGPIVSIEVVELEKSCLDLFQSSAEACFPNLFACAALDAEVDCVTECLIMEVDAVFDQCVMRIWSFSFLFKRQDDE
jgi:hypothetical protein